MLLGSGGSVSPRHLHHRQLSFPNRLHSFHPTAEQAAGIVHLHQIIFEPATHHLTVKQAGIVHLHHIIYEPATPHHPTAEQAAGIVHLHHIIYESP